MIKQPDIAQMQMNNTTSRLFIKYSLCSALLVFFGLMLVVSTHAQAPIFKHLGVEAGLGANVCYSVEEGPEGYIWIATENGVSRYDGMRFTNFTYRDGLPNSEVIDIYKDSKGDLWFFSISGRLSIYRNRQFFNASNDSTIAKLGREIQTLIIDFSEDDYGNFWFVTRNRVYVLTAAGEVKEVDQIEKGQFRSVCRGPKEQGIFVLSAQRKDAFLKEYQNDQLLHTNRFNGLAEEFMLMRCNELTQQLLLALPESNRLMGLQKGSPQAQHILQGSPNVFDDMLNLVETDSVTIWALTHHGIVCYNMQHTEMAPMRFLADEVVSSMKRDHAGNYWVATLSNGIYFLPAGGFNIMSMGKSDMLSLSEVRTLERGAYGELLVGYHDGLIDVLKGGQKDTIDMGRKLRKRNRVNAMLEVNKKHLVIGMDDGLYLLSRRNGKYVGSPRRLRTDGVKDLVLDQEERIWMATSGGCFTMAFSDLLAGTARIPVVKQYNNRSTSLMLDHQGRVWIGTENGAWVHENGELNKVEKPESLAQSSVQAIVEDANGVIYMSAYADGVYAILPDQSSRHLTRENGLGSNACRALFVDEKNNLWIGTNKGVNKVRLQPDGFELDYFSIKDGLINDDVKDIVVSHDSIWVGTSTGISLFKDEPFALEPLVETRITAVRITGKDTLVKPEYTIDFDQNNVAFEYVGLSFKSQGQLEYRYCLEGYDTIWHSTLGNEVNYTALPAGKYKFVLQAKGYNTAWNPTYTSVAITVLPPYWQTTWFILLICLGGIVLLVIAFWGTMYIIRKRDAAESVIQLRIAEAESKALRAQMNPHFIFNSLNSIQRFITKSNVDEAYDYLQKFGVLIRKILESSESKYITLEQEVEGLEIYLELEALRIDGDVNFEIKMDPKVNPRFMKIPSMLIQPYVENAIWHGLMPKDGARSLMVEIKLENDLLICCVEDNGIGREKSAERQAAGNRLHRSMGMSATKDRLAIINAQRNRKLDVKVTDLTDEKGSAIGTRVELFIPIE